MLFTSESVSEGHPDKMCDQIADAILDAHLSQDPTAKVACEVVCCTGMVLIFGEISSKASGIDYQKIARDVIKDIGYDDAKMGFDYKTCSIMVNLVSQASEIASGVHVDREELCAGDQGLMFGYATNESEELMPVSLIYARNINLLLHKMRRHGVHCWIRPDSKTQVTVEYDDETAPEEGTMKEASPSGAHRKPVKVHTRKIIVDTYGGGGAHGGGSFSGKDPSKVDRSGAYAARWVAKSLVKSKLCDRCLVQISYAIGVAKPVSISVMSYGTGKINDEGLAGIVKQNFDLRPAKIIEQLKLDKPIYRETSKNGHFGHPQFTWEQ